MQYLSGGPWSWSSEAHTAYPRSARAGLHLLRSTATEWPFHADATGAARPWRTDRPATDAGVRRHGKTRSDGSRSDLLETKGVVMITSELRRSTTRGPRTPAGRAGTQRRGGIRRGSG